MQRSRLFVSLLMACSGGPKGPDTLSATFDMNKTTLAADGQDTVTITFTASNIANTALPTGAIAVTVVVDEGSLGGVRDQHTATVTLAGGTGTTTFTCPMKDVTVTLSASTTPGSGSALQKITCGLGTQMMMEMPAENLSSLKLDTTSPVIVNNGTSTINATVLAPDGTNAVAGTVVFSTSLGTLGSSGASTESVKITAGKASVVLNAPSAPSKGITSITASFTDSLGAARAAKLPIRIVDANQWSLVLEQDNDALVGLGQIVTVTGTIYKGADKQSGLPVTIILSGPSNIGTLVPKSLGGTADPDGRAITNVPTDDTGRVLVDFFSGVAPGAARIEFRFTPVGQPQISDNVLVTVDNPIAVAGGEFIPDTMQIYKIRVKGSVAPNQVKLTFLFIDDRSNPVADGTPVSFALSKNVSKDVFLTPAETTTSLGLASTYLNAGGQAENVTVTASAVGGGGTVSSTSPAIAIVGGIPEWSHMAVTCSVDTMTIAGLAFDNLHADCTALVADRFSNTVDFGTQISFRTEAGRVTNTATVDPLTGDAKASMDTMVPHPTKYLVRHKAATLPHKVGDVDLVQQLSPQPFSYSDKPTDQLPNRPFPDGTEVAVADYFGAGQDLKYDLNLLSSRGSVRMIAITQGEESFVDINGNKIWDQNEPFIDLPEPFIDKNDNGVQDSCLLPNAVTGQPPVLPTGMTIDQFYECYEDFIDLDGDNTWSTGNGRWDNYTLIWKSVNTRWTGAMIPEIYPLWVLRTGATIKDTSADLFNPDGSADVHYPSDMGPVYPTNGDIIVSDTLPAMSWLVIWGDENHNCDPRGEDTKVLVSSNVFGVGAGSRLSVFDESCMAQVDVFESLSARSSGDYPGSFEVKVKDQAVDTTWTLGWTWTLSVP